AERIRRTKRRRNEGRGPGQTSFPHDTSIQALSGCQRTRPIDADGTVLTKLGVKPSSAKLKSASRIERRMAGQQHRTTTISRQAGTQS
ncbi:hypothetical protein U1Q18_025846, partial [Sarracenia purpurea var. burkii]